MKTTIPVAEIKQISPDVFDVVKVHCGNCNYVYPEKTLTPYCPMCGSYNLEANMKEVRG